MPRFLHINCQRALELVLALCRLLLRMVHCPHHKSFMVFHSSNTFLIHGFITDMRLNSAPQDQERCRPPKDAVGITATA